MGRKPRWISSDIVKGVGTFDLSDWKYFSTFIHDEMLDFNDYVWRGQADSNWLLESSLTRYVKSNKDFNVEEHLNCFKFASRGRRGSNPKIIEDDNEWWALGQHHGLMTPLLDWSESPFVAAFFSFNPVISNKKNKRAIYGIHKGSIAYKSYEKSKKGEEIVEFINPLTDENSRLVSQRGLFTKIPLKTDLESWITDNFNETKEYIMIKITIPEKNRFLALRQLNRMNINSSTLFPDLNGASEFCNMNSKIENY